MKTFLIALGGAIVGASAACLLWAEPCASTRRAIREKTAEATNELQEFAHEASEQIVEHAKELAHRSESLIDDGKGMIDRAEGFIVHAKEMVAGVTDTVSHGQRVAQKARTAMAAVIDQDPEHTLV